MFDTIALENLHERHPGLTQALATALCEAASVCLSRHHTSPKTFSVAIDGESGEHPIEWQHPSARSRLSHGNTKDATEDGAYAVSLACIERRMGLVTVGRTGQGSRSDWWLAPVGQPVMEEGWPNLDLPTDLLRLEVSGQDRGPLGHRMRLKKEQVGGIPGMPGLAAVVGFERALVRIERVFETFI